MSARFAFRCACGAGFWERHKFARHVQGCAAATGRQAAALKQAAATTAPKARVRRNLPGDWRGDLDQPSLPLEGVPAVVIKGRAS